MSSPQWGSIPAASFSAATPAIIPALSVQNAGSAKINSMPAS
jgi:hypothetical protein